MKPKISVIMCVYNAEKYLADSIESILNQSFENFEFIIVEDNSKDNSKKIIKRFLISEKRIKLISNKNNLGAAKSRNRALQIARGKYIAIMDADDISLKDRLKIEWDYLEKHPEIFMIGGGVILIDEKGNKLKEAINHLNEKEIRKTLSSKNCFYHPSVMFRKDKKIKYRDKIYYCEDYDLYLTMLTHNKRITIIPDILIKYRINSGSISLSKKAKQMLFSKQVRQFYLDRIKYGKDNYSEFDAEKILSYDIKNSKDREVLKYEILGAFLSEDLKKLRRISKRYLKIHGYSSKIFLYYSFSFLGKEINRLIKKLTLKM